MKIALIFLSSAALSLPALFSADIPDLESRSRAENPDAQFELARAFLKGDGVPKDPARALELMKSAANQGHAEALGGVGYFYANGLGVPKDEAAAVEWFRKGAEAGGPKSQLNLGKVLAEGKGCVKNEEEGKRWIKASADQGLPDALYAQGCICYFGKYGQAVDYPAAHPYLLKAAQAGHSDAQNLVGVMLENAQGVDADTAQAEQWFRKAAEQGHVKAQSNLGMLIGLENPDQARRLEALAWLMVASKKGEITATKELDACGKGLSQDDRNRAGSLCNELEKSLRQAARK